MKTTSYIILGAIGGSFLLILGGVLACVYFSADSNPFIINDAESIYEILEDPEELTISVEYSEELITSDEESEEINSDYDTAQGHK